MLITAPMRRNTMAESMSFGLCTCTENCGGEKTYRTITTEVTVETRPPASPPIQALRKTAGKKKSQSNGLTNFHSVHCRTAAMTGTNCANTGRGRRDNRPNVFVTATRASRLVMVFYKIPAVDAFHAAVLGYPGFYEVDP